MQKGEKICQHIFVVSLQQIRLKTEKPVDCIVKYSYDLLCDYEVTTSHTFTIEPGSEDTRIVAEKGFNEYKIYSQTCCRCPLFCLAIFIDLISRTGFWMLFFSPL